MRVISYSAPRRQEEGILLIGYEGRHENQFVDKARKSLIGSKEGRVKVVFLNYRLKVTPAVGQSYFAAESEYWQGIAGADFDFSRFASACHYGRLQSSWYSNAVAEYKMVWSRFKAKILADGWSELGRLNEKIEEGYYQVDGAWMELHNFEPPEVIFNSAWDDQFLNKPRTIAMDGIRFRRILNEAR